MPKDDASRQPRAFTLVELLVVIGIIALLVSILLPTLSRARESASRARCLSNNRQLIAALQTYANDEQGKSPDASWDNGNVYGNPYSPRGSKERGWGGPYEPWTPITDGRWGTNAYVTPSIGGALLPYVGDEHENLWTCGSAPVMEFERAGAVYGGDDPYNGSAGPATRGDPTGDRWIPNYHYMSMKGQFWNVGPVADPAAYNNAVFKLDDWLVRNIAGLPIASLRSVTRQGSSEIVVFRPFLSTNHTAADMDIYDLPPGTTGEYGGTYAFLDGHATFETYEDVNGYLAAHHDPIPQTWFVGGTSWTTQYATQYGRRYR